MKQQLIIISVQNLLTHEVVKVSAFNVVEICNNYVTNKEVINDTTPQNFITVFLN